MRAGFKLSLDADAQTEVTRRLDEQDATDLPPSLSTVQEQISQVHMSLVSRIHELEIQNYETQKKLDTVLLTLECFKRDWERKAANEKNSELLLRNIGILS